MVKLQEGVFLRKIPTNQFKTNMISVYFKRPISREEVTINSLIPYVMRSATVNYPTETLLFKRFQELYGASLGVSVSKMGEMQVIRFRIVFTDNRYLQEDILEDILRLFREVLFEPYLEEGAFSNEIVEIEKEVLRESILSKINDKAYYAREKLIEMMCQDEPYGISEEGYVDDLEEISSQTLYRQYLNMLESSEINIYLQGQMDFEKAQNIIVKKWVFPRSQVVQLKAEDIDKKIETLREETEMMDVEQGKLVLGYRTRRNVRMQDYYDLVLYSVIFGGSAQSKLFRIVREKHSLCYSIGASLEKFKGIMVVQTGIESKNKAEVVRLIFEIHKDMTEGRISEEELEEAKKLVINSLRSLKDSVSSLSHFYFSQDIHGNREEIESLIERVKKVEISGIQRAAKDIEPDSIFFLKGREKIEEQ